jgi:hypothetical protein
VWCRRFNRFPLKPRAESCSLTPYRAFIQYF